MKVRDIMTSTVITLSPDMGIVEAAKILMDNNINGAPVLDKEGVLVGILCRDDLISQQKKLPLPSYFIMLDGIIPLISPRHLEKEIDKITATNVEHAMTAKPVTVSPDADIDVVAGLMVDKKIHTIPVVDQDGTLIGIVGKEDILKTLIPPNRSRPIQRARGCGLRQEIVEPRRFNAPALPELPPGSRSLAAPLGLLVHDNPESTALGGVLAEDVQFIACNGRIHVAALLAGKTGGRVDAHPGQEHPQVGLIVVIQLGKAYVFHPDAVDQPGVVLPVTPYASIDNFHVSRPLLFWGRRYLGRTQRHRRPSKTKPEPRPPSSRGMPFRSLPG